MGIFIKKKQKSFNIYSEDSEEDNHVVDWMVKSLTHNDDGIDRDKYYPQASGSSVKPLYPFGDPTTIPIIVPVYHDESGTFNPYKHPVKGIPVDAWGTPALLTDDLIDQLWEKMYSRPVIVRCGHCDSHNAITNPTCVRCGAPMGSYKEMKKYEKRSDNY